MSSPKRVAAIEQESGVAKIYCLHSDRPVLAKRLAEGKIERGMTRKVAGSITIEKARTVPHVAGYVAPPRQIHSKAGAESVALVVIEKKQISRRRKIRQSAGDGALTLRPLMRVGQVKLGLPKQLR